MEITQNRANRQKLQDEILTTVQTVFPNATEVKLHWELQNASTEHSNIYASIYLTTPSVTRSELTPLEQNGIHLVEHVGYVTENPDMDNSLTKIPREHIRDAAEVNTELVVELSEDFINNHIQS